MEASGQLYPWSLSTKENETIIPLDVKPDRSRSLCADGDEAEIRQTISDYPTVSPSQ